jgi:FAD/FMN-containing dehydrogenase
VALERSDLESWGRGIRARHVAVPLAWRHEPLRIPAGLTALPYGLGRSYGDSCLNDGGALLLTRGLDRFIAFDTETGVVRCEAGVSFDELLRLAVPHGWFPPVTPGTRYVTVGGALANDVHGKSKAGTFGAWVRRFELVRSDGQRLECAPDENADWFGATIAGLGLTGLVTWVELQLLKIPGPAMATETVKFDSLEEFFSVNEAQERAHAYTVAWIDVLAKGAKLGRGLYMSGDHAPDPGFEPRPPRAPRIKVPVELPGWVLNRASSSLFNLAYYHRQQAKVVRRTTGYVPFFYPLDAVDRWNRVYGRRGLLQYQCVVPPSASRDAIRALLEAIAHSGRPSFLAVLKTFGEQRSPGWLSFPRPGATLALDFPDEPATRVLLDRLDAIVDEAGGAVYPAKDARLSGARFRRQYPEWERLRGYVDPRFSSMLWRRVTGDARAGA